MIDWNAAVIYDRDYWDAANVLELLNVELLEARFIDAELDKRIIEYQEPLRKPTEWSLPFRNPYRKTIHDLAELRIESLILAKRVENALKLIGDQYLARIHNAAPYVSLLRTGKPPPPASWTSSRTFMSC